MATQLVQYMDLRRTIDVNPPAYDYPNPGGQGRAATSVTYQPQEGDTETPSEVARIVDLDSDTSHQTSRQSSKQESRPSTKDTKVSGKSGPGKSGKGSRSPTRQSRDGKSLSRTSGARSDGKEYAEVAIQDEGGDPSSAQVDEKSRTPNTRHSKRALSTLAPVLESDFDSAFDLFDDDSWAAVPNDQTSGRFAQYRRLTTYRLSELEEQLELTNAKTKRKVNTLKAQFQEHKSKWEAERRVLIEQVEQSLQLQTDAEKEADAAMTQLEDFITEQERLEEEEEVKRTEVLQSSTSLTPQDGVTPLQGSLVASPTQQVVLTPESEQELQRLMQQTDDAKVQELNARLGTCASAPPMVSTDKNAPQPQPAVEESISSLEGMKIEGATEEEIRSSSSLSRASLRNAYKTRLEETKSAAEDRRSKSPHISLPTQLTVDDELILDEDDDDDEFTDDMFKDPSMYEIGTSPPPPGLPSRDQTGNSSKHDGFRKGFKGVLPRDGSDAGKDPAQPVIQKIIKQGHRLLQHPILKEYLTTYEGVVSFKDNMSKMFLDKDMMSAHQMTSDLEMLTFDSNQKAMPQVEEFTKNVCHVLQEISTLISSILVYDREPPVSSLHLMSREATQKSFVPPTETISEQPRAPPGTRNEDVQSAASSRNGSQKSGRMSVSSDKVHIKELQVQYNELKTQLDKDSSQHQEQLQRNTVVMMEMQDTINDLHRELSALGKKATRVKSASSVQGEAAAQKSPSPETSVMFTRLDSERNAKIMKKAVVEEKLDQDRYKEAVARMDEYVSLPAQRLAHLVKKYVHHRRMRDIEEKVKKSSSLDEEVFNALDKMENLQNQRARQWAASMDEMGIERLRLANLLMNTLDNIEQESGIFLIKPMYSYRGRNIKPGAQSKLSRPLRSQHRNPTPSNNDAASSFIPAPTPASNYRLVRHERHYLQQMQQQQNSTLSELRPAEAKVTKEEGSDVKVMGSGMTFTMGSPRTTWNMQASQPFTGKEDPNSFNTPRILELDINRMLIGQNNISSKIPFPPTDDRLVNASQNSLRSYVTVNRPTASFGAEKTEKRPGSGRESSSRSSSKRVTVSETDKDIPTTLPSASPLPPITPIPGEEPEDFDEEEEEEEEEYVGEKKDDGVRPPSVAFTNEDEEEEGEDGEDTIGREPPQSPPGSSMYQSTLRNEDSESAIKPTRASSRLTLSDDEN